MSQDVSSEETKSGLGSLKSKALPEKQRECYVLPPKVRVLFSLETDTKTQGDFPAFPTQLPLLS